MKMKALKLALLAAGLVSGSVSAAFTEGDLVADNSITLNGEITNTNPVWAWKTGADQTDWDTTKLEWKVSGTDATADFSGKGDVILLDGYLTGVIPVTTVGVQPVITVSGDGYKVTANAGKVEQAAEVTIKGLTDAGDPNSTVYGKMTFKLVQGAVGVYTGRDSNTYYSPTTMGNVAAEASSTNANYINAINIANNNMQLSNDWAAGPYVGKKVNFTGIVDALGITGRVNTFAGFHSNINSAKVTFPAATIPESWEGALTVTVAYQ
ncbi:hypothetical protein GW742_10090 [Citrobacter freundii]|nr:hypothetical protein [Citrobacter freundii]MBC6506694.1 hypothetical protein [Citrobacter freundii]